MAKKSSHLALVEDNLGLVEPIARRLFRSLPAGVADLEDLVQVGMLGLISAARTYRPDCEIPFSFHARVRIRGSMLDLVRAEPYPGWISHRVEFPIHATDYIEPRKPGRRQVQVGPRLARALAVLDDRERRVLDLAYDSDLSNGEVAKLLGIGERYARELRARALAKLREFLEAA